MSLVQKYNKGYLEMIIGPMFSGKSTELINIIRKYKTLNTNMMIIKPSIDNRYTNNNEIHTHNHDKEKCITYGVNELSNVFNDPHYADIRLIAIEEGQFFMDIYEVVKKMTDEDNKIVYITALNGDFNRQLFGDIYKLLPLCDNIKFMQALCVLCNDGTVGVYSKRLSRDNAQVLVAGADEYQAVCRNHFLK